MPSTAGAAGRPPVVAADIEGESNLHHYGERFCLLQLYDGNRPAVVDPMSVSIEPIKSFLESESIGKLFYDAASDRTLLYKTHGILLRGTIDLKVAVELLDMEKQGLDSVLQEALGIDPPASKKKFQQYNWTKRPIAEEAVDYALRDVLYLFDLEEELFRRLEAAGKVDEFAAENARRDAIVPDLNRKPGVLRSRRFERLSKSRQRKFERLYGIREIYAERLDMPPNSVVANNDLFAVAAGKLALSDLRPNRRVPRKIFEELRTEMRRGESGDRSDSDAAGAAGDS
jgi:ribonuclease D